MTRPDREVIIVGGGPAGLSAELILARSRRSVSIIDNGEPRNAPAVAAHGLLGLEGINPLEFLARGRDEVASFGGEIAHGKVVATTSRRGVRYLEAHIDLLENPHELYRYATDQTQPGDLLAHLHRQRRSDRRRTQLAHARASRHRAGLVIPPRRRRPPDGDRSRAWRGSPTFSARQRKAGHRFR